MQFKFNRSSLAGLFIAMGLAGMPRSIQAQFFGASAQRDIDEGVAVAKLVEQQIGLYPAPQTQKYLREVGERLETVVNDNRWMFSFQIVDQPEPNAFAIP